jgi:hypothetical protein
MLHSLTPNSAVKLRQKYSRWTGNDLGGIGRGLLRVAVTAFAYSSGLQPGVHDILGGMKN